MRSSASRWLGKLGLAGPCVAFWLTASVAAAEPSKIVGDLSVPRWNWRLFGPVDRDASPLESDLLKTLPPELTIAGKTFKPRPLNVEDKFGRCNLGPMIGGTEIGKTAYVLIPFNAKADMDATLGFGSGGRLQAWMDGTLIMDTMTDGDMTKSPTIQDRQVTTHLTKGSHLWPCGSSADPTARSWPWAGPTNCGSVRHPIRWHYIKTYRCRLAT